MYNEGFSSMVVVDFNALSAPGVGGLFPYLLFCNKIKEFSDKNQNCTLKIIKETSRLLKLITGYVFKSGTNLVPGILFKIPLYTGIFTIFSYLQYRHLFNMVTFF